MSATHHIATHEEVAKAAAAASTGLKASHPQLAATMNQPCLPVVQQINKSEHEAHAGNGSAGITAAKRLPLAVCGVTCHRLLWSVRRHVVRRQANLAECPWAVAQASD